LREIDEANEFPVIGAELFIDKKNQLGANSSE